MKSTPCPTDQTDELLGEIAAKSVGMQYYGAEVNPGEQVHQQREPDNTYDKWAIRVDNGRFESVKTTSASVLAR